MEQDETVELPLFEIPIPGHPLCELLENLHIGPTVVVKPRCIYQIDLVAIKFEGENKLGLLRAY